MERWIYIIRKPASINQRFNLMINLLIDINSQYSRMFYFDHNYDLVLDPTFKSKTVFKAGGSMIQMPSGTYRDNDRVLSAMERDQKNFCLVYGVTRYLNNLTKLERAVIMSNCFRELKRKDVMTRFGISKREYYSVLDVAKEKLIELWRLDTYGDMNECGIRLDRILVDKRRTERTGLIGGYFRNNTDWKMQYYKSQK